MTLVRPPKGLVRPGEWNLAPDLTAAPGLWARIRPSALVAPLWVPAVPRDVVSGATGALNGDPETTQTEFGAALSTDGTDDAAEWSGRDTSTHPDITLLAALRFRTVDIDRRIMGTSSTTNAGYHIGVVGGPDLSFSKGGVVDVDSGLGVAADTWYALGASYRASDGAIIFMVANMETGGVAIATTTNTSTPNAPDGIFNVGGSRVFSSSMTDGEYVAGVIAHGTALTEAEMREWAEDPFAMFRPARRRRASVLVAGGTTVTVGLATETSTAFGVGAAKTLAVGLSTEADTGLATTAEKTATVGLGTETDSGLAVGSAKALSVGLPVDTQAALALTASKTLGVGLSTETDTALAVSTATGTPVGLATSTETALATSVAKVLGVGLGTETDEALAVTVLRAYDLGLASETDVAFAVSLLRTYGIGLATESDAALATTIARAYDIGLATETDTAFGVIVVGVELDLRPPFTAVWVDPARTATWTDPARTGVWTDPDRTATWMKE